MELKALVEETLKIFNVSEVAELSEKLKEVCICNDTKYFKQFKDLVGNLHTDWLQKIFQYYEADRKTKGQDYTPSCLAKLVGILSATDNEDVVYDMCAGSGALTIQKWSLNPNLKFICKEFDEKVIPFLLFNLALRNIEAEVIRADVLQNEEYEKYHLFKGEEFSVITEVM